MGEGRPSTQIDVLNKKEQQLLRPAVRDGLVLKYGEREEGKRRSFMLYVYFNYLTERLKLHFMVSNTVKKTSLHYINITAQNCILKYSLVTDIKN